MRRLTIHHTVSVTLATAIGLVLGASARHVTPRTPADDGFTDTPGCPGTCTIRGGRTRRS